MKRLLKSILPIALCSATLTAWSQATPPTVEPPAPVAGIPADPAEPVPAPGRSAAPVGGGALNVYKPATPTTRKRAAIVSDNRRGPEVRAFGFGPEPFGGNTPTAGRPLMIRSSRADAKAMEQLREDLAVMSRILDKVVTEHAGDFQAPKAAGIDILTLARAGAKSVRTMYVDDYGAIFTLNVNMPLKAEPKPEEVAEKESTRNGAWEDARNEVLGQKRRANPKRWQPHPGREFDQGEVDELKSALIDTLKYATNIRNLKPSDLITVVVRGVAFAPQENEVSIHFEGGHGDSDTMILDEPSGAESTLVLRVTKAELDRAGTGKESSDLRKAVRVSVY